MQHIYFVFVFFIQFKNALKLNTLSLVCATYFLVAMVNPSIRAPLIIAFFSLPKTVLEPKLRVAYLSQFDLLPQIGSCFAIFTVVILLLIAFVYTGLVCR